MYAKGFIKKELSAGKFKTAIGSLILIALAVSISLTYEFAIKMLQTTQLPDFVGNQAAKMRDYSYFVWFQWFGKNYFQTGSMLAVIFGSGLISSEVSRRTVHFLLTKPLSRQKIFNIKYVVSLGSLLVAFIVSTTLLYVTVIITGHSIPVFRLIQNTILSLAGFSLIYSVAVYFSTIFDQTMKAFLVSILIVILSTVPGFFSSVKNFSLHYQMLGENIYTGHGFPFIPFVVIVALTVLVYKLAKNRFMKADY